MVYISKVVRIGQRSILNGVVETATVITSFECPVPGYLVVKARYKFVLAIRLDVRCDGLLTGGSSTFSIN